MSSNTNEYLIDDLKIGDSAESVWEVTNSDIQKFADLTGDLNPLHLDCSYARASGFTAPLAHGFLISAMFSRLIGMELPGKRCLLLEQKISYPNPVYESDKITLKIEVLAIHKEFSILELKASAKKLSYIDASNHEVARGKITCKIRT